MSKHKNQHVTPQTILKHFAFENKVYIFDTIANTKPSNPYQTIGKVSTRTNFYDFNEQELKVAEETFKKVFHKKYVEIDYLAHNIEDSLGKFLLNIVNKNYEKFKESDLWIDTVEKADLSFYITIQLLRSPVMKKLLGNLGSTINEEANKLSLSEYDSCAKDHLGLHHYSLMTNPNIITNICGDFFERKWTLGINKTELPFFTSDNPVVINEYNTNQIIYPLSSKYIIIMERKDGNDQISYIDNIEDVKQFNRLQLSQSDKDVFSEKDCFDWITDKDVKKKNIHQLFEQQEFFQKYIQILLLVKKLTEAMLKTSLDFQTEEKKKHIPQQKKKRKKRR